VLFCIITSNNLIREALVELHSIARFLYSKPKQLDPSVATCHYSSAALRLPILPNITIEAEERLSIIK
jgi:hypothetical protein